MNFICEKMQAKLYKEDYKKGSSKSAKLLLWSLGGSVATSVEK